MIRPSRTTHRISLAVAILTSCAVDAGNLTNPDSEVIQMHKIEVDPANGLVTLRWSSQIGSTYAIEETSNPKFGWQESVRNVSGGPLETSFTILPQRSKYGAKMTLFRVRKMEESVDEEYDLQTASAAKAKTSSIEISEPEPRNGSADRKLRVGETSSNSTTPIRPTRIRPIPKRGLS